MRKRRLVTGIVLNILLVAFILPAMPVFAQSGVLLVYRTPQEEYDLSKLIWACGQSVTAVSEEAYKNNTAGSYKYVVTTSEKPLRDTKNPVLCIGDGFSSTADITFDTAEKKSISVSYSNYTQPPHFEKSFTYISHYKGSPLGKLELNMGQSVPFAVVGSDRTYAPYYHNNDLSVLILGAVMKSYLGGAKNTRGTMYIIIDEIYPFSDLNMLCKVTDSLYKNAIPFIVSIVPVYDNLDYPAYLRYMQVLRYVQSHNGSIVLHEPVVEENAILREPLEKKMERFYASLKTNNVQWMDISLPPYALSLDSIESIKSSTKNFGELPFDTMIEFSLPKTKDELDTMVQRLNRKWLSLGDYKRKFTNENFQYAEIPIDSEHTYIEQQQQSMVEFFFTANEFLIYIVGGILVLFFVLIFIGYRIYKKKFFNGGSP